MRNKNLGKIILLHDGGGNREVTIQALPILIDQLRSQGYEFVSLQKLLGRDRDEFMPPLSLAERGWATVGGGIMILRGRIILSGYAYETVPNKPLVTGKTKGPDVITLGPGTLGRLARGVTANPKSPR
jgi:hypothetical protein